MVLFILLITGICLSFGYVTGYNDATRNNKIPFIINDTNMANRKRQLLLALSQNLQDAEYFSDTHFMEIHDITTEEYFELCEAVGRVIELACNSIDGDIEGITHEEF